MRYRTPVWLLTSQKPIIKRQVLVGTGKVALFRRLAAWGEGRHIQEPTPKILLGHESFEREKGETISVNRQGRGAD